jgi:hypothetical protein
MKTKLLAMLFLAGGSMFAQTRFSVGIGVGGYGQGYYQQAPAYAIVPAYPGPGYTWIDGYWAPGGGWINGYWFRQPYSTFSGGYYGGSGYYGNSGFNRGFDRGREVRGGNRGFERERVQSRSFSDNRNFSSGQNRGGQSRGSAPQSQGNNRGSSGSRSGRR